MMPEIGIVSPDIIESNSNNAGMIIGIASGIVASILIIGIVGYTMYVRYKKRREETKNKENENRNGEETNFIESVTIVTENEKKEEDVGGSNGNEIDTNEIIRQIGEEQDGMSKRIKALEQNDKIQNEKITEQNKQIKEIKKDKDEIDQRLTKAEQSATINLIVANVAIKQVVDYLANAKAGDEKIEELKDTLNKQEEEIDKMTGGGVSGEIELGRYVKSSGVGVVG